ncbi:MAG: hypothetical protein AAF587_02860 [Bacteroidota bacterium]
MKCISLLLAFVSVQMSLAQVFHDDYFRSRAEQGLDLTYNFEFEEAEDVFEDLLEAYQDHPAPYFLLATNRWWQSYITIDETYHAYIEEQLDLALDKNEGLEDRDEAHLEYVFFQYMCYAFKTRLHTLRREWLSAANEGRKALPYLRDGLDYARSSPEFYFSAGIYHYYAATYPDKHYYVRPFMIFFPDGDEEKGIEELELAANTPNFAQPEAMYYLGDIYLQRTGALEQGIEMKRQLHRAYPNNSWFKVDYAKGLIHAQQYEEADILLTEMIAEFENLPDHRHRLISSLESTLSTQVMDRVYHYQGVVLMRYYQAYEQAIEHFGISLELGELGDWDISPLPPSNYLHIGLCYDRLEMRGDAIEAYESALDFDQADHVEVRAKACLKDPCK